MYKKPLLRLLRHTKRAITFIVIALSFLFFFVQYLVDARTHQTLLRRFFVAAKFFLQLLHLFIQFFLLGPDLGLSLPTFRLFKILQEFVIIKILKFIF